MIRPPGAGASGALLARNTAFNLAGHLVPLAVALAAIPVLIQQLGAERFGILAIAWVVIGYFGLFDLGIGRALTHLVAKRTAEGDDAGMAPAVWTALALMMGLGAVGALVIALSSGWLAGSLFGLEDELAAETRTILLILSASLPLVTSTAGLRGVLEARQMFGLVNLIRVPQGVYTYGAPVIVLLFVPSLVAVVAALAVGRFIFWLAHLVICLRRFPVLRKAPRVERALVGPLVRFGGWLTVSNVISPLMTYVDRFLIGAVVSMAAVAHYVTPYEAVTRLWILPGALLATLFPAFASTSASDRERTSVLFAHATKVVFLAVFPICAVLVAFAHDGLALWAGAEFADAGAHVLRLLAIGVFLNCLGQVAYTLLQGVGRPDVTAKVHLLEVIPYVVALYFATRAFGIVGAATVWALRVAVDASALFALARALVPEVRGRLRGWGAWTLGGVGVAALLALPPAIAHRLILALVVLPAFLLALWRFGFALEERRVLRGLVLARIPGGSALAASALTVVALLAAPGAAGAQQPAPVGNAEPRECRLSPAPFANSADERYLRLLQLRGDVPLYPWTVRSFSPGEAAYLLPRREGPWHGEGACSREAAPLVQLLPAVIYSSYNSDFAYGANNGALWEGRGLNTMVQAGVLVQAPHVSLTLAPTWVHAQNRSFPLGAHGRSADLPYADWRNPRTIDLPQRFGDEPYARFDPGQTTLRVEALGLSAGLSNANEQWGPAYDYPLILGNNAPGFLHLQAGTARPWRTPIGAVHGRALWGRLEQSAVSDIELTGGSRFMAGMAGVLIPRGLDGVELGFSRFFHLQWPEDGVTGRHLALPFQALLGGSVENPRRGDPYMDNQLASVFARWVLPRSGFEVYGEFAREDYNANERDLMLQPDHDSAYLLGAVRVLGSERRSFWLLRGEVMNARVTHLRFSRNQVVFYRHSQLRQGHTHRGHTLGAPAVYGGAASSFAIERYHPAGSWSFRWLRELRSEGTTSIRSDDSDPTLQNVMYALEAEVRHSRGPLTVEAGAATAWDLNRFFQEDARNLQLRLGVHFLPAGLR